MYCTSFRMFYSDTRRENRCGEDMHTCQKRKFDHNSVINTGNVARWNISLYYLVM